MSALLQINTVQAVYVMSDTLMARDSVERVISPLTGETGMDISTFQQTINYLLPGNVPAWQFVFLLFMLAGYAVARTYLGRLSSSTFMAAVRYNNSASMYKDNSQLQRQRDSVLLLFYFLSSGFFGMIMLSRENMFPYHFTDYKLFLFLTFISLAFFYSRTVLLIFIGHVFNSRELFREHLYHGYAFNKLLGIVLVPLNLLLVYSGGILHEITIWLSIAIIIAIILLKLYRGIIFSIRHHVFNFYLFLYLCALELVPILFLIKWFSIIIQ